MREDELFKSHIPVKRDGVVAGYRETPYCTIMAGGYNITVKAGKFYGLGGDEIDEDDVPQAVWDQLENMNPVVLAEIGVNVKAKPVSEVSASPKPAAKK